MYATKAITTFALLAFLGQASAGCFNTGKVASPDTIAAVQSDSSLESICSHFIGEYKKNEDRNLCMEYDSNKYQFYVKEIEKDGVIFNAPGSRTLGIDECKKNMKYELGCTRGGYEAYSTWYFRYVLFSMLHTR
jgi:hypothetical protein